MRFNDSVKTVNVAMWNVRSFKCRRHYRPTARMSYCISTEFADHRCFDDSVDVSHQRCKMHAFQEEESEFSEEDPTRALKFVLTTRYLWWSLFANKNRIESILRAACDHIGYGFTRHGHTQQKIIYDTVGLFSNSLVHICGSCMIQNCELITIHD